MIRFNKLQVALIPFLIALSTSPAIASSPSLPLLQKLESCQQTQYNHLEKLHQQLSNSAHLSSMQVKTARKSPKRTKKETKLRARESELLSLDSSVLALINQVILDQQKSIRMKNRLKKAISSTAVVQIAVEQVDELSQFAEKVDQNFHEIAQKSFMLKIKDDREFQSCVGQATQVKSGV